MLFKCEHCLKRYWKKKTRAACVERHNQFSKMIGAQYGQGFSSYKSVPTESQQVTEQQSNGLSFVDGMLASSVLNDALKSIESSKKPAEEQESTKPTSDDNLFNPADVERSTSKANGSWGDAPSDDNYRSNHTPQNDDSADVGVSASLGQSSLGSSSLSDSGWSSSDSDWSNSSDW